MNKKPEWSPTLAFLLPEIKASSGIRAHPEKCETVFGMRVRTDNESADLIKSDRNAL
ncbi:hypothetical protein CEV31_0917 [Brucella thiophenivorans]|uniref:Uncharacterized protein n=1 Tax=Brucella thiophenivorans TaxID=571255 RepID=A0A256G0L1_9HYPH|nr:hypothetical protein CEV31_0917 [Brucella thiophenivorans]